MRIKSIIISITFIMAFASHAIAGYILDAGDPFLELGGPQLNRGTAGDYQWLARKFSTSSSCTVRTIECHLFPAGIGSGNITAVIYGSNYGPDKSSIYFEKDFYFEQISTAGWHGLYSENFTLGAGDYWIAFEVRDPNVLATAISSIGWTYDPSKPYLPSEYAFDAEWKDGYTIGGVTPFAVRIGDSGLGSPVPEPATMIIFGLGLAATAFAGRKKSR